MAVLLCPLRVIMDARVKPAHDDGEDVVPARGSSPAMTVKGCIL